MPTYSRNSMGQTMGKGIEARTPDELPDLIAARTLDGRDGYVLRTDLENAPTFISPKQAVAWSEQDHTREINVYLEDGQTVIGQLTVG